MTDVVDPVDLPIHVQRDLIGRGGLTPEALMEQTLRRIAERNGELNAVVTLRAEAAMDEAVAATRSRPTVLPPLHGIPFTVKDTIEVAGVRTTAGSRLLADNVPGRSATVVTALRAAGAILVGRTHCAEFGMGNLEAWNPLFGQVRNPWDTTRTPGGSSGGDSAAVAAGMTGFGVGTDYGGSVRFPAHCTGIAALRPTPGRVPTDGVLPHESSAPPPVRRSHLQRELQTIGFLTRSVADLALLLRVTAGTGPSDRTALPTRCAWFTDDASPETADTVRAAAEVLAAAGLAVTHAMPPGFLDADDLLARGRAAEGLPEIAWLARGREAELGAVVAAELAAASGSGSGSGSGSASTDPRDPHTPPDLGSEIHTLRQRVDRFMADRPILLMPVAIGPAFEIVPGPPAPRRDFDRCTRAVTLLRLPAVVVACGTSGEGLPIGIQVVGRPGHDEDVLAVADLLERAYGPWRPTRSRR